MKIQFFTGKGIIKKGWWDIAVEGKREGYIIERGYFFEVTLHNPKLYASYTTFDRAIQEVMDAVGASEFEIIGSDEQVNVTPSDDGWLEILPE